MKEAPPHIVTDSTCNIPPDEVQRLDIDVVHAAIIFTDRQFLDGIDITQEEFMDRLKTKKGWPPKTASPGPGPFEEIYNDHPGPMIVITADRTRSGLYRDSVLAAENLGRTTILPVDSGTSSWGLGFPVKEAARLAQEGWSQDKIIKRLNDYISRTFVFAYLDTTEYLKEGGRANEILGSVGTLLNIKPVIQLKDNKISFVGLARTQTKSMSILLDEVRKHAPFEQVAVVHADNLPLADRVADGLSDLFDKEKMVRGYVTPALTIHTGPGAVGVIVVQAKRPNST